MEGLFVLAGLFLAVILIGVPYLLVSHSRLKSKVSGLELQLTELRRRLTSGDIATAPEESAAGPWAAARARVTASPEEEAPRAETSPPPPAPESTTPEAPPAMAANAAEPSESTGYTPPRAFVFNSDRIGLLNAWLRENWVLAVAAASLALAGIFMVQYGVEHGLLTPFWRVMAALGFGAALIAAGEWIRRRHGDQEGDGATATLFLPSTLSAAGLITLFAGVLSARVLYDLIAPGPALAGLCAVAVLAIVLGWFYGPVLAAVGLLGASAAPFVVGGQSDAPWVFYYYFLLVGVTGLGIDTIRRWAWVSVLALILSLAGMALLHFGAAGALHFIAAVLLLTIAALTIPVRSLVPNHTGAAISDVLRRPRATAGLPDFPARLAFGVVLAASLAALWVTVEAATPDQVWLGLGALMLLIAATLVWLARAPALYDLALLPGAGFLLALANEPESRGELFRAFSAPLWATDPELPVPDTAWIVYTLTAFGVVATALAFWRMRAALSQKEPGNAPVIWALASAVFAPAVILILEFLWQPAPVIGDMPWALTAIATAAVMTLLAERTARGADTARLKLRTGLFAVAALTLISLSLFLLLTKSALTLALAVMAVLTALLDRRFDLPVLGWFLQLGVAVISYRLVVDPGLFWAVEHSSLWPVLVAYDGALALLAAAWVILDRSAPTPARANSRVIVESALWTIGAVFLCVLLARLFGQDDLASHWGFGLLATVWLASATAQAYRFAAPGLPLRWLRALLGFVFALIGAALLAVQATFFNPLDNSFELVLGPPVLDSLAVAYLPVAMVFAVAVRVLTGLRPMLRAGLVGLSALYGIAYVGLEIRRLWRGRDLSVPGVTDPELYSYTLAMLLGAVLLLMLAFARRSVMLRKLAMIGVALTIAKVFLIDMSGLSGLTRVFSFMGLGLALVALAWVNRKMTAQWDRDAPAPPEDDRPPAPDPKPDG